MLVLKDAGLVYLANPKTAGRALRLALEPFAVPVALGNAGRHIPAQVYQREWRALIEDELGRPPETFAVMREPRAHMESWFRFRQRDRMRGHSRSTHAASFADFVEDRLSDNPPDHARIGRQDLFLGFGRRGVPVTHVFDYARLDLLLDFLAERLGQRLVLPVVNVSPPLPEGSLDLPEDLEARYRRVHRPEFALYDRVARDGVLVTRP
ncbi:MAG TPA: gamma-glutamyl kinase [Tabrizicola sp.]|nr:gamma-glutamyl kinase [Tabrizicola sp.]